MNTTATSNNSKPERKQLSEQIDRLDAILDGLSDALEKAVGDAAREGTRRALQDAIVEILTDPTLRIRLHQASAPASPPEPVAQECRPSFWQRLRSGIRSAVQTATQTVTTAVAHTAIQAQSTVQKVAARVQGLRDLGSLKRLLVLGAGVGVTVALASYLAPHTVAAAVSGIGGALATAALQISVWTQRTVRTLKAV